MTLRTLAAACVAATFLPFSAHAQPAQTAGFYGSAAYARMTSSGRPKVTLNTAGVRGGYAFTSKLAVEAEGFLGLKDDGFSRDSGATRVAGHYGLDYLVGAFGVARAPISPNLSLFGRAGVAYARADGEARTGTTRVRVREKGALWAAGAGLEFAFDEANAIRAQYTRYEDDAAMNAWGVSYVRRF